MDPDEEEGDGDGTEHVLLVDEGPKIEFGDPEDVESAQGRIC
jgi:hypothetical protein